MERLAMHSIADSLSYNHIYLTRSLKRKYTTNTEHATAITKPIPGPFS